MFRPAFKFFVLSAALSLSSFVSAQDCACNSSVPEVNQSNQSRTWGLRNCGRGVSQQKAAGLWAGYCNADCSITVGGCNSCGSQECSGGCRRGSKLHGLFQKSSSCDQGCDSDCGHTCKLKQRIAGFGDKCNSQDGHCFGWPPQSNDCQNAGGSDDADCGCESGCKIRHLFKSCKFSRHELFQCSKDRCGCSGAYFDECIGFEYGTAGMQSCIGPIMDEANPTDEAPGKPSGV
jgi:hypothetical protein